MHWQPTVMPPSAAASLTRARAAHQARSRQFSKLQEFVAGLYWFTTLPHEIRLELVHEFRSRPVTQDRHKTDTAGVARLPPGPPQSGTAGFAGST
jgi:hypothetical protein